MSIYNIETTPRRGRIFELINRERAVQVAKGWSKEHDQSHSPNDWLSIIVYEGAALCYAKERHLTKRALIKIAAVCVAAVEALEERHGPMT